VSAELSCTCGPGESIAGTRQEVIEQRLAAHFGMEIPEVHALLDLQTDVLDAVLAEFPENSPEREPDRRIAAASGRDLAWVTEFFEVWEAESDTLDHELPSPYRILFESLGSNPGLHENEK
jgi:hypothetical protein